MPGKSLKPLQQLAMRLAFNCVRNSPLEDIHADGRISDAEMKDLMVEITDQIYTGLTYPELLEAPPPYWKTPKIVRSWKKLLTLRNTSSTHTSTSTTRETDT